MQSDGRQDGPYSTETTTKDGKGKLVYAEERAVGSVRKIIYLRWAVRVAGAWTSRATLLAIMAREKRKTVDKSKVLSATVAAA